MEAARPQSPPEITISTSPRSSSFFDRVLRRTSSGSSPTAATLSLPPPYHNTSGSSRSSSRSSHKRAPLTIDTSVASTAVMMSNKKTKTSHLTVETTCVRSIPRSRSRNRPSRSPSPNVEAINHASRVASINHVGRHTNDWLFGGFHLTSKIGAPRGRSRS